MFVSMFPRYDFPPMDGVRMQAAAPRGAEAGHLTLSYGDGIHRLRCYGSVHNYSTYPMLLHKCSKYVVFLNEISSKYVVNIGERSKICSIHSFIH